MPTTSPTLPAPAGRASRAVPANAVPASAPGPATGAPIGAAVAARTGRGLGGALLGYLLAVTLVVTLAPFDFRWPGAPRIWLSEWTVLDMAANVLLFVPLGFLLTQAWGPRAAAGAPATGGERRAVLVALALGIGASAAIEALQLLVPQRYTSPLDVLTNGVGAALGAAVYVGVRRQLDPARVVGRLGLELPLMGLVYLLVPLGWLDALSARGAPERWWPLLCLGLFGASVLGAAQHRHFGPAGLFSARGMAAAAAGWFALCSLPALTTRPLAVAGTALAVAALTWHRARDTRANGDRRFEVDTLLRAAPFFAAYLLLLALSAPEPSAVLRRPLILQMMETMAAFTLVGYMTAESQGRRELRLRAALPLVSLVAGTVALATVAARTAGVLSAAELPAIVVALLSALYGGWLYHLQRAHVRALLHGSG